MYLAGRGWHLQCFGRSNTFYSNYPTLQQVEGVVLSGVNGVWLYFRLFPLPPQAFK